MQCNSPISLNKDVGVVKVPCGRCFACTRRKARAWAIRIMHEARFHEVSSFVTLTYADQWLPYGATLLKRDLQLFIKRLRRSGLEFRYYAVGEYGGRFGRPHYHLVVFGQDFSTLSTRSLLVGAWSDVSSKAPLGLVHVGTLTPESSAYVAGYINKVRYIHKELYSDVGLEPEFSLMSRRPGIGFKWFDKNIEQVGKGFVTVQGSPSALPRYYKDLYKEVIGLTEMSDDGKLAMSSLKRACSLSSVVDFYNDLESRDSQNKSIDKLLHEVYDSREAMLQGLIERRIKYARLY